VTRDGDEDENGDDGSERVFFLGGGVEALGEDDGICVKGWLGGVGRVGDDVVEMGVGLVRFWGE